MAKKLTKQTLERMVIQTINESKEVNEIFGFGSLFGRDKPTTAPSQGRPLSGLPKKSGVGGQSDMDQLLSMIMSDPKVPSYIKDLATDVFAKPDITPKMSQAQLAATRGPRPLGPKDIFDEPPEIPDEEKPTSIVPTVKGVGAPNMNRRPGSVYSSPQAP